MRMHNSGPLDVAFYDRLDHFLKAAKGFSMVSHTLLFVRIFLQFPYSLLIYNNILYVHNEEENWGSLLMNRIV